MIKQFELLLISAERLGSGTTTDRQLLESFYFACKIKNLRNKTLKCYAERLKYLVDWCIYTNKDLYHLTKDDLQLYIHYLIDKTKLSGETINGRIRVFRVFYSYLVQQQFITQNPTTGISLLKTDVHYKPMLKPQQLEMIFQSFNGSFTGTRNRSMIAFFLDTGVRVGEVCSLTMDNVDITHRRVLVKGKSRFERIVPISHKTAHIFHTYIIRNREYIDSDYFFCTSEGNKLREGMVYTMVRRIGERVGLKLYPHLFRHIFATNALNSGMPQDVIQHIMGLTTPIVLSKHYLHLSDEDVGNIHQSYSPLANLKI